MLSSRDRSGKASTPPPRATPDSGLTTDPHSLDNHIVNAIPTCTDPLRRTTPGAVRPWWCDPDQDLYSGWRLGAVGCGVDVVLSVWKHCVASESGWKCLRVVSICAFWHPTGMKTEGFRGV